VGAFLDLSAVVSKLAPIWCWTFTTRTPRLGWNCPRRAIDARLLPHMTAHSSTSLKVLMIEDNKDLCAGWLDIFDLIGHELRCYGSGVEVMQDREALQACDLVISDFYLPDINGVDSSSGSGSAGRTCRPCF
jgi:hypothetical protein